MTGLRKTVGARELKTRLGGYLRAVRSGAIIIVTERGEPVAELRPVGRGGRGREARLNELAALGLLTRGDDEPLPSFEPVRSTGRAASDDVDTDRGDRF